MQKNPATKTKPKKLTGWAVGQHLNRHVLHHDKKYVEILTHLWQFQM